MTTSIKRPILLQVKSLQDNYGQLRRQRASDQIDASTTPCIEPRKREIGTLPASKRRPHKTQSLVLPSPTNEAPVVHGNSRSSIPSKYEDLLQYYSTRPATDTVKSASQSNSSISSCSSTSTTSSNSETNDSPSLILPHLYVGDQAQTQIDTLSSLNISYVLSLQSLPKFLDESPPTTLSESELKAAVPKDENVGDTSGEGEEGLLPSINSSKDYLVKIDPNNDKSKSIVSMQMNLNELAIGGDEKQEAQPSASPSYSPKDVSLLGRCLKKRCDKISSSVHKLIRGKCINISDTFEQLVDKFFDETHSFIEEARRNRCNVLIHCKAGISRSPTIAIAYLMKWKRLHLQDAYNFVKRCRPQIAPNLNFMGQLVSYERQLQMSDRSQLPSPTCCLLRISNNSPQQQEQNSAQSSSRVDLSPQHHVDTQDVTMEDIQCNSCGDK